jgi:two-component system, OmpR family, response regulator AdeR
VATILVVDDDHLTRQVVVATLTRAGHVVHTHDSGFGLAVAVHHWRPDVVLLDVNMPGLSGTRSLEAAARLDPEYGLETRVLLHSGAPVDELQALASRVGAHGSLAKPARPVEIVAAVEACLASPRRRLGLG